MGNFSYCNIARSFCQKLVFLHLCWESTFCQRSSLQHDDSPASNCPFDATQYILIALLTQLPVLTSVDWPLLSSARADFNTFRLQWTLAPFFAVQSSYLCVCMFRLQGEFLMLKAVVPSRWKPKTSPHLCMEQMVLTWSLGERKRHTMKSACAFFFFQSYAWP